MSNNSYVIKLYNEILETLTEPEYELISYGPNESYHEKLERIRLVTDNQKTLNLCRDLKTELKKIRLVSGEGY